MFRVFITALLMISLFGGITAEIALAENDVVKIGVLANRGPERCLEKWTPTAEYLTRVIQGKTFMIVPVDFEQIYAVVEKGEIDFILANPSIYVGLETWYGVSPVATLINKVLNKAHAQYGAVVFTKKHRDDIRQYSDLKGKTFMAVHETSLGGWWMAWREFKEVGVDPFKDFAALSFGGTHDAVVYAVRDGKVDAGTVRTDTLERMQVEGKINISDFKVIHEHGGGKVHLPFVHSTRAYPEKLLAKVKHTPVELAEKVAKALLALPADSPAARASESAGWTIPSNYNSVHECLKELKVGPYKDFGEITLLAVFKKYWLLILIDFATLIVLAWFLSARIKLSRKLKTAQRILQSEVNERKRAEERTNHLNLVLRALRDIIKVIVTEKDHHRLIKSACDNFIMTRGYHNAWIALFDESGNFTAAAEAGVGEGFSRVLEMLERGDLVRCCREALGRSSVLVIADPVEACKDCPQAKGYAGREAMAVRLEYEDKIYGILSVSVPKGVVTDREELALFNEVAGDIAFALYNIEAEGRRLATVELLRESEEKYRVLVENANDSILVVQDDILKFHNSMTEEKTGFSSEELASTPFINLVHPEDRDMVDDRYERRLKGEKLPASHSFRVVNKTGEVLWVHLNSTVVSWDGRPATLNFIRDITQQKKLEAQFRQAQKMEAVGTLAGGVAHDFNNLLSIIIGNAQLALMKAGKDDPLREEVEEINLAGERAAALTRQLLAFSRKQIIQLEIMDLNELLTGIEKMLGRLIGEDVEILVIPQPALWWVEVDSGQMEQVIMNLAINARDAMPQGGKLTVETANVDLDEDYLREHGIEEQPGTYVMLALSDTGIGMDKETQEHIFEPFFTTKGVGKGTGLGLSTVYGIVKQNNGFIWVYSEPGQGTTFKIYLPEYKGKGDAEPEDKDRTPVAELDGSETVLIVEDDERLRKFARKALQSYGYRILDAEDGEDALRVGEEHDGPINLLIADVVMPKMSGKEAADRLQPLYPQMKVIYMSGYTDNSIAHHGILEPGLNFLEKPFSPEILARKVREVLDA